jgi:hypothetical protein
MKGRGKKACQTLWQSRNAKNQILNRGKIKVIKGCTVQILFNHKKTLNCWRKLRYLAISRPLYAGTKGSICLKPKTAEQAARRLLQVAQLLDTFSWKSSNWYGWSIYIFFASVTFILCAYSLLYVMLIFICDVELAQAYHWCNLYVIKRWKWF